MKKSSKLILLCLYSSKEQVRFVKEQALKTVVLTECEIQPSGWKSALYFMAKNGLIQNSTDGVSQLISLTAKGRATCESIFPALGNTFDTWTKHWSLVVFSEPPKGDAQFRYLRVALLAKHAMPLTRGVYLLPSIFLQDVTSMLQTGYEAGVYVFDVAEAVFGGMQQQVFLHYNINDRVVAYSGVSKELERLLESNQQLTSRLDQQKRSFFMVFNRFWELLGEDPGFTHVFTPSSVTAGQILARLQQSMDALF